MDVIILTKAGPLVCPTDGGDCCTVTQVGLEDLIEPTKTGAIVILRNSDEDDPLRMVCELRRRVRVDALPVAFFDPAGKLLEKVSRNGNKCVGLASKFQHLVKATPQSGNVRREFRIDPRGRDITINGRRFTCSPLEFRILLLFLRFPGVVLSREEVFRRTGRHEASARPQIVDVMICRLRKKIEENRASPKHFLAVPRVGFVYWNNDDVFIDALTKQPFRSWPCTQLL